MLVQINKNIYRTIVALSMVMMAALIFFTGWQVFGRYVLNDTPTWTEQFAIGLVLYIVCFMSAAAIYDGSHLKVSLVSDQLNDQASRKLEILVSLVIMVFAAYMFYYSGKLMYFTRNNPWQLLGISRMYFYLPMVLGGAFTTLFCIENIFFPKQVEVK
ncbi:MAG: TRAP transporter small permease [Gammaproteobacteria bacterium]|nr:TRAP transporter small permease [Gammaproteobacteria bacterium]